MVNSGIPLFRHGAVLGSQFSVLGRWSLVVGRWSLDTGKTLVPHLSITLPALRRNLVETTLHVRVAGGGQNVLRLVGLAPHATQDDKGEKYPGRRDPPVYFRRSFQTNSE